MWNIIIKVEFVRNETDLSLNNEYQQGCQLEVTLSYWRRCLAQKKQLMCWMAKKEKLGIQLKVL